MSTASVLHDNEHDLVALIASAAEVIPDDIEYALYAYVQNADVNSQAIHEIVMAYGRGDFATARILVDALDGSIDGKLFNQPLDGANVPRRSAKIVSDPD